MCILLFKFSKNQLVSSNSLHGSYENLDSDCQLNLFFTCPSPPAGYILPLHPWWRRLRERGGLARQAQN